MCAEFVFDRQRLYPTPIYNTYNMYIRIYIFNRFKLQPIRNVWSIPFTAKGKAEYKVSVVTDGAA